MSHSKYIENYNFALKLVKANQFSEAEKFLSEALRHYPDSEKAYLLRAQCLASMSDVSLMEKASELLRLFLCKNLNHRKAQRIWAEVNWRLSNEDWTFFYQQAIKQPKPPLILVYDYCGLLLQSEKFFSVDKVITKIDPYYKVREFDTIRIHVLYKMGEYEKALRKIETIALSEKTIAPILRTKAKCELALGLYRRAEESARLLLTSSEAVEQGDWALLASTLKANDHHVNYRELCNFDKFVNCDSLDIPAQFSSTKSFHETLAGELEKLHGGGQHPIEQSVRNGSQTDGNLFAHCQGATKELAKAIKTHAKSWADSLPKELKHPFLKHSGKTLDFSGSWSVKLASDGHHTSHYHNSGWISGCYYVLADKSLTEKGQGWLKLGQSGLYENEQADYFIRPEAGVIVLFPSYFWHSTTPFESNDVRLAVAFDILPSSP